LPENLDSHKIPNKTKPSLDSLYMPPGQHRSNPFYSSWGPMRQSPGKMLVTAKTAWLTWQN